MRDKKIDSTRRRLKWHYSLIVILVLAAIGGALLAAACGGSASTPAPTTASSSTSIAKSLGNLKLIGSLEGDEALSHINSLHGTNINLVTGYIAEYKGTDGQATVWVGQAANSSDAGSLLQLMIDKIGQGSNGFSNVQPENISDKKVYAVSGPGGDNAFYAVDNKVVWLTITASNAQTSRSILEQALKTF